MAAIGLAIVIVAGVVTIDVVLENTRNTEASVAGQTLANVDLGGFFTAGVLVGIALTIGLILLLAGLRRARRQRLERKELTRSYEGSAAQAETLQEERDRLAAELESERRARADERTLAGGAQGDHAADVDHVHGKHVHGNRADDEPAPTPAGATAGAPADTRTRPVSGAPVYPGDPAPSGAAPTGPATVTQDRPTQDHAAEEHPKPSLRERLLGR